MKIKVVIVVLILVITYGFFDKNRKETLYKDFRSNKPLICNGTLVQKSKGWRIHHNRFFTNGKESKTVVFCRSIQ
ncbi:hypothetical protein OAR97_05435 [Arcobacteraceae bacterium]|nr:hypothetical protein [Arcobacteraceae bacterium]